MVKIEHLILLFRCGGQTVCQTCPTESVSAPNGEQGLADLSVWAGQMRSGIHPFFVHRSEEVHMIQSY